MNTYEFEDGKYTLQQDNTDFGRVTALRHGEEWREFVGDTFMYLLVSEFFEQQREIEELQNEVRYWANR